jgi:hypothetical protein
MPIKSFRKLMGDLTTDRVVLHSNDGSLGYRIIKFRLMTNLPGADQDVEHVVKIYKIQNDNTTTQNGTVDFSDNTLLAAGFYKQDTAHEYPLDETVMFDQEIFNDDIFITHKDNLVGASCNYYIELEQIKLDLSENTVATLKDIRNKG